MTTRSPDWWLSAWDEYGHSLDTGRIVQVTVGILEPECDPAMAISVAGETPVKLTNDAIARLQEHLDWAVAEHQILLSRAGDHLDAVNTDTAMLGRAQWQSVVAALRGGDARAREEAVKDLKACAPTAWVTTEAVRTEQEGHDACCPNFTTCRSRNVTAHPTTPNRP